MTRSLLAVAALIVSLALPGAGSAQTATRKPNPARVALGQLERQADTLFVAAEKRDWAGAKVALDGTKSGVNRLRSADFEAAYADAGGRMEALYTARHRLDTEVAEADIALGAQESAAVMRYANQLTLTAAQLGAPIEPPLAHQVQVLAYLARELEYARAAQRTTLYTETVAEIRQLWAALRPALLARKPPPDLSKLEAAVARLGPGQREDAEAVKMLGAAARSLRASL